MSTPPSRPLLTKLASSFLVVIWLIVPLQWFWLRILEAQQINSRVDFFLTQWYEGLIWLVGLIALLDWLAKSRQWRLQVSDWLALIVFTYAWLLFCYSHHTISDQLIGLRFSIGAIYAYFLGRQASFSTLMIDRVLLVSFWLTIIFGAFQLVAWKFLSADIMKQLAITVTHRAVSLPQLYGSLVGPNQFGLAMLIIAIVAYYRRLPGRWWLIASATVLLVLSISRSAVLAGVVVLLVTIIFDQVHRKEALVFGFIVGLLAILGLTGLAVFSPPETLRNILTHGQSDVIRLEAVRQGFSRITQSSPHRILLGFGAGTSGPATIRQQTVFITENWYLQTLYEYGVVGSLLFWAFLVSLFISCWKRAREISMAILAILVVSCFLLPLSDNPAVVLWVFGLAGLVIGCNQYELQKSA